VAIRNFYALKMNNPDVSGRATWILYLFTNP